MSDDSTRVLVYFSDYFDISPDLLDEYGAFNISLVNDLPLFIDPFLLFNSERSEYQELHSEIIKYLEFLRDKSLQPGIHQDLLLAWFTFREVKQNWFGYSKTGNGGTGLGPKFAKSLNRNLNSVFSDFGSEQITKGSHLEKLCVIDKGIGRDSVSDFTTNLIKHYLLTFTERFAVDHLSRDKTRRLSVAKARFNYLTGSWMPGTYTLPFCNGDFVILTPRDILTKDDTWISQADLFGDFERVADSIPNAALRGQINNYFLSVLPKSTPTRPEPTKEETREAKEKTIRKFPVIVEHYIRYKEDHGDQAVHVSDLRVAATRELFVDQAGRLIESIRSGSSFYDVAGDTYTEAHERLSYLRDAIENSGCHKYFYHDGKPIRKESDLHIMYRLVWCGTVSDVSREVDDGRGPADFKISRGAGDKTIVEFKLASNSQLKRNLQKQAELYQKASDALHGIKVILFFSEKEQVKVAKILNELELTGHADIVLIDARDDNKPSASKA